MTEKLSPQQKLIKKYKGKTFEVIDEQGWIRNNAKISSMGYHTYCPYSVEGVDDLCAELNELYEEKESLKGQLETYHEGCKGIYDDKCKLEKENERLIKMLDNVANYMQKEHREIPIDYFVEWWNKIATEGLD